MKRRFDRRNRSSRFPVAHRDWRQKRCAFRPEINFVGGAFGCSKSSRQMLFLTPEFATYAKRPPFAEKASEKWLSGTTIRSRTEPFAKSSSRRTPCSVPECHSTKNRALLSLRHSSPFIHPEVSLIIRGARPSAVTTDKPSSPSCEAREHA